MDTVNASPNLGPTPDLAGLLASLNRAQPEPTETSSPAKERDLKRIQLVEARLGVASGLFAALRAKHEATAMHCLRVALGCSAWSLLMDMTNEERDALEIAALLHDVGKIGVPDAVLMKPGKLQDEEIAAMDQQKVISQQILAACCSSADVLEIVHYSSSWFDGSTHDGDVVGKDLPLGARVLAIVDAFDAMTTDQVYRRAMPKERVLAELYHGAGSQFDPDLVADFCSLTDADRVRLDASVGSRWLQELKPANAIWAPGPVLGGAPPETGIFYEKLSESMMDALVFVNHYGKVEKWNRAAERMTGVAAESILGQAWSPELIGLRDEDSEAVVDEECPVRQAMLTGVQAIERGSLVDGRGHRLGVNFHVIPVRGDDGCSHGAAVVIHDASNQITLEERVQSLHVKATQDPLTKVANRAEFDRVHAEFIDTHIGESATCSLIICDIDHFKRVNDNYGHQAGDEALTSFAAVLQGFTRSGDLVARYGGEEFVLLCADCDHVTATRRAEEIRSRISSMPQPMLNNMSITASFGVTSLQAGDTPDTMLARADRALLQAKDTGRNRVVQLGTGLQVSFETQESKSRWFSGFLEGANDTLVQRVLYTAVPMEIVVEKLRGFVGDHRADIVDVAENVVCLQIDSRQLPHRRDNDRTITFLVNINFHSDDRSRRGTDIHVQIRPKRKRDRRVKDVEAQAMQLLGSVRAYFMATEEEQPSSSSPFV